MKHLLLTTIAALVLVGCGEAQLPEAEDISIHDAGLDRNIESVKLNDRVLRWAQQILLGPEFGGEGEVCSLWVESPSISVFGGSTKEYTVVMETVLQLNEILTNTKLKQLRMVTRNNTGADIRVYFIPLNEFFDAATKHGFTYVKGNLGYFWTFWNAQHEINRAYVLLASDKLRGEELQHFALEEITQALGLSNDSPIFHDSIFHSGNGNTLELSELDRKLVRFFYNYVKPGTNKKELEAALIKYWSNP